MIFQNWLLGEGGEDFFFEPWYILFMNVVVINSPLVQLNAPYPSGAYLCDFFKGEGCTCRWFDLSNRLFYSIFSSSGLKKLFDLSLDEALKIADESERAGDEGTAFNLRRYVSCSQQWIEWIDFIVGMLCSGRREFSEREMCHKFLFSPFAPRGNRMEGFLGGLGREASIDDVRFLCSYALADLADYITAVFDKDFSLVRYAEALTVDESSFSQIEKKLDSPVLTHFYLPVLQDIFSGSKKFCCEKVLVCISVPFAGTFVPALYTARFLKEKFGDRVYIAMGGGFVNTELREAKDESLLKYIDALSFDRGYGSYKNLFDFWRKDFSQSQKTMLPFDGFCEPIYKLRQFMRNQVIEPLWNSPYYEKYELEKTVSVFPDYSDIDFSVYPRVCDDTNAMHRMWNDGAWIKAYLAHGCYWHKCAFCDVNLDYVCAYKSVDIKNLFKRLLKTAQKKGVYGIHLVDEALPPRVLKEFALLNAQNGNPLYFWGNVRFEKTFSKDLAAFLSYCGFGGVSAGIEAATGPGLENINKGTDIQSIVNACAAFKESGILVHAYMIYGFWNDSPQTIVDSMETLRQFFEAGLLDSAFWHKFVLTRNSRVFGEWKNGLHKELKPVLPKKSADSGASIFAGNNVHFEGEAKYEKFGIPLENALNCWMHGQKLGMKVQKWFDFPVPAPSVKSNFIEECIQKYEEENVHRKNTPFVVKNLEEKNGKNKLNERLFWLGSKPVAVAKRIVWNYLQEEECLFYSELNDLLKEKNLKNKKETEKSFCDLLWKLRPGATNAEREAAFNILNGLYEQRSEKINKLFKNLHYRGIVIL